MVHLFTAAVQGIEEHWRPSRNAYTNIASSARHDENLEKLLTEEQKEIFEKYQDCWNEYARLAEAAIFEYAFKMGMQFDIETLAE